MKRAHRSPIWKMTLDEFSKVIANSHSITEILSYFDLENKGSNHVTLKQRIEHEGIDWSHIKRGPKHNSGRKFPNTPKKPLDEIMTLNSGYNKSHLKRRLLQEGILNNVCYTCGLGPEWYGKPLSLHMDHSNGNRKDDRKENLRMLCPNCHSQTETYAGKRRK